MGMFGYPGNPWQPQASPGFKMDIGENIRVGDIVSPGISNDYVQVVDRDIVESQFGIDRYKFTYQPLDETGAKHGPIQYGFATSIMPFKVWAPAKFAKHSPINGEGLGGPKLDESVWGDVATALAKHEDMHGDNDSDFLHL